MRKVIKMDLILNQNVILINLVVFGACLVAFSAMEPESLPHVYAGMASFMMAFLPAVLVTREDKFNAMTLGCSLPVRRKTIVQARFVFSIGMAFLGIVLAFLLGAYLPTSNFQPRDLFAGVPLLVGFSGITLVLSVLLPFTLRFGMKGIMIFLIASQVLGVVALTLTQITDSDMDRRIIGAIGGFLARSYESFGATGFNLLVASCLAVLLTVSYLVSVRIFENREL